MRRRRLRVGGCGAVLLGLVCASAGTADERWRHFVTSDGGTVVLKSKFAKDRSTIRYRRPDGTYDLDEVARLARVFRSGDGGERQPSLRLIEILGRVYEMAGERTLVLNSGYRSPTYNEGIRKRGAKAAGGSMHTEAMAADVAIPGADLEQLWLDLRALECCGVGFYGKDGFLHIDTGRPRFWEAHTSKVDENLSGGNARLFARTEWDRYHPRETVTVSLHAMTLPPVHVAKRATIVFEDGERTPMTLDGPATETDCMEIAMRDVTLRGTLPDRAGRGHVELAICEPRLERTPESITSNPIEVVRK